MVTRRPPRGRSIPTLFRGVQYPWGCRTSGAGDDDHHIDQLGCRAPDLWKFAGNELQWMPRTR